MVARLKENEMSIYLVRWPDLSASLVPADGDEQLLDILDQVGNPDDCEWNIYDGPLFIDFRLPVEWSIQDDLCGTPSRRNRSSFRMWAGSRLETSWRHCSYVLPTQTMVMRRAQKCFAWPSPNSMLRWKDLTRPVTRAMRKEPFPK